MEYSYVTERYCPVVGQNVAFVIKNSGETESVPKCLIESECIKKRGRCKNQWINANQLTNVKEHIPL